MNDPRLAQIVEGAEVVEAPLYLQIARELHERGMLDPDHPDRVDTRGVDRVALRVRLLDAWTTALVKGYFRPEVPLSTDMRQAAIVHLAALACVGLENDTLEVKFDDLQPQQRQPSPRIGTEVLARIERVEDGAFVARLIDVEQLEEEREKRAEAYGRLLELREQELEQLEEPDAKATDMRLAANRGFRLGLVEPRSDGVLFPHSIMQAYLGSRLIRGALRDSDFLERAIDNPSRELLVALVMFSRSESAEQSYDGDRPAPERQAEPYPWRSWLRDALYDQASRRAPVDAKSLDLFAAAFEVDGVDHSPQQPEIAKALDSRWDRLGTADRTIEDAKLKVVMRFGDATRALARKRAEPGGEDLPDPAYETLYEIGAREADYPIRLAIAQQLGAGGDQAFDALKQRLNPPARRSEEDLGDEIERLQPLQGWLLPLLVTLTTDEDRRKELIRVIDKWLTAVGEGEPETAGLTLSAEAALAQGFKHAANRRPGTSLTEHEAREMLKERARDMLRDARWWFSRLTLVQALTLWHLRERPVDSPATDETSDPVALVEHWLHRRDDERERHPFVIETAALAVQALETGQPERFLWIDESGVATTVGSRADKPQMRTKTGLWIPPSAGWSALDPPAQRLVADVLILLNLAERGKTPADRDRRRRRSNRDDLPPCLTENRDFLAPLRTVGTAENSAPGANCKDGCEFELCPYPPKGEQAYRSELSEAFCRQQRSISRDALSLRTVRRGTWSERIPSKALREFWGKMENRARR